MSNQNWKLVSKTLPTNLDANKDGKVLVNLTPVVFRMSSNIQCVLWDVVIRYPEKYTHWAIIKEPLGR